MATRTDHYIELGFDQQSEIRLVRETQKAVLIQYDTKYFGKVDQKDVEFWIPKSVWNNPDNFELTICQKTGKVLHSVFKKPYWCERVN